MKTININKKNFFEIIKNNDNFILTTHINSDGDGLGSEAALYYFLKSIDKNVAIINKEKPSQKYNFLGISDKVSTTAENSSPGILFIIDCNELSRINQSIVPHIEKFKKIVILDHHREPQDIKNSIRIIDHKASSVCEIVFLLLQNKLADLSLNYQKKISQALYTGIIFDTNNFSNSNVTETTYCISGKMISLGADNKLSYKHIFEDKPNNRIKLLGLTLSSLTQFEEGKIVFFQTTQNMLKKTNTVMQDANGFTKEVRPDGFRQVVVYMRETDGKQIRVSLRSGNIDVQKIAKRFNGGGHKLAAGFKTESTISQLKKTLLPLLQKELS